MKISVRLFAVAKQLVGSDSIELEVSQPADVKAIREALVVAAPALGELSAALAFSVDEEYAADDSPVQPTSNVACIPPVSGG